METCTLAAYLRSCGAPDMAETVEQMLEAFALGMDRAAIDCAIRAAEELTARRDELLAAEHKLSDAYLRLREKLKAFDTPPAPTPDQVYSHTEAKLDRLIAQRDQLLAALKELLSGQTIEGLRGNTGMMGICVTGEDVRAGLGAIAAVEQPAVASAAGADGWIEWEEPAGTEGGAL